MLLSIFGLVTRFLAVGPALVSDVTGFEAKLAADKTLSSKVQQFLTLAEEVIPEVLKLF